MRVRSRDPRGGRARLRLGKGTEKLPTVLAFTFGLATAVAPPTILISEPGRELLSENFAKGP